jgi:pimeloyl-ACP methyl ester carboxylesterase
MTDSRRSDDRPRESVIPAPRATSDPGPGIQSVDLDGKLEVLDLPAANPARPEILLLHEGLGSVSMWRDFPQRLAEATGSRIVAYSRHGFGRSSPRTRAWTPRFVHEEALEVIPALRSLMGIERPVLLGHSTGASMALVHAGADRWPVAGVIAMAPLTDVQGSNLQSIERARALYEGSDWRSKLERHHDDVDTVFYGWNDTWLRPDFRSWNLRADLKGIRAPILAILGKGDEYATPDQVEAIRDEARGAVSFDFLHLEDCGHAPHRDQPEAVVHAVKHFVGKV